MLTKKQIQEWTSLRLKKYRLQHQKFIAEGEKIVDEIIDLMPSSLLYIISTKDYADRLSGKQIELLGGRLQQCNQAILDSISALTTPSPVMAIMKLPSNEDVQALGQGLSLYLDGVRDPGNLGSILRIADWFGIRCVYMSDDCVDVYNPKTIQATMGAFLRVKTNVTSLDTIHSSQTDLQLVGTLVEGGQDAMDFHWNASTLLVIGSESHGVRSDSQGQIQQWVSIPRGIDRLGSESLNAAVATGILCSCYVSKTRSS